MLQQFSQRRRLDANLTVGFTDLLIQVFDQHPGWLQRTRSMGLLALDLLLGYGAFYQPRDFLARNNQD